MCTAHDLGHAIEGVIGACRGHNQDYSKDERRALAKESRERAPQFGSAARQALTAAAHETVLRREKAAQVAILAPPLCSLEPVLSLLHSALAERKQATASVNCALSGWTDSSCS